MIKVKTQLVKPTFSIKLKQEEKNLIDYILDEMKSLDISQLKLDPDFLKYIAELIENQVQRKSTDSASTKPSKLDILIEILKRLFPSITDEEIAVSKGIVEFLLKNDCIKKVSLSKIMLFYIKKKVHFSISTKIFKIINTLVYPNYITNCMNAYNVTRLMLSEYSKNMMYFNAIQNYILFPVLMEVLHHKAIVLIIITIAI